jgi:hypothetical protein
MESIVPGTRESLLYRCRVSYTDTLNEVQYQVSDANIKQESYVAMVRNGFVTLDVTTKKIHGSVVMPAVKPQLQA